MRRRTRRQLLAESVAGTLAASVFLTGLGRLLPALGEDRLRGTPLPEPLQSRLKRQEAIRRGCAFLATKVRGDKGFGDNKAVVALTGLCVLALMAGGSSDGRGPHGAEVRRGISFLLDLIDKPINDTEHYRPEGYFGHPEDSDSKMHGQGYASLALAMALGTSDAKQAARVRAAVVKAVKCMESAQTETGGYGYEATPHTFHEGSVTVCVAQALRAARDGGILVSDKVVQNGLRYLRRSQIRSDNESDGGFKYSESHTRHTYALTAAAISSFFLFGVYVDDEQKTIERGLRYMMRQLEKPGSGIEQWYYYGHFYGAWAFWQKDGGDWRPSSWWGRWQAHVLPDLLDKQQKSDGSWDDHGTSGFQRFSYGQVLATAFAVLTLAIPDESLPIFQR
jgi:hypothetical protein